MPSIIRNESQTDTNTHTHTLSYTGAEAQFTAEGGAGERGGWVGCSYDFIILKLRVWPRKNQRERMRETLDF